MKNLITIIFVIIAVMFNSCDTTDPPTENNLTLTAEDIFSTDAAIKISTKNISLPSAVKLLLDNVERRSFTMKGSDTVLFINNLTANTTHTFQAKAGEMLSEKLTIRTMDTINHAISWEMFEFGEHGNSVFFDVEIIDENNIWAVGEIYTNDSLGQPDPLYYGFANWNGNNWNVFRLKVAATNGNITNAKPRGIFILAENDIWFSGGSIFHWDGIELKFSLERFDFFSGGSETVEKLWGNSSEDIFGVGNKGTIVRYNGSSWIKLASGTEIDLTDIYGTDDGSTIWSCGWDRQTGETVIVEIKNNNANVVDNSSLFGSFHSLYLNGRELLLGGNRLTRYSLIDNSKRSYFVQVSSTVSESFDPGNFVLSIRGNDKNDIYVAGDLGMLWHYNGKSWHKYNELYNEVFDRRIFAVDVKDNVVAAVGWKGSKAWVVIGKK